MNYKDSAVKRVLEGTLTNDNIHPCKRMRIEKDILTENKKVICEKDVHEVLDLELPTTFLENTSEIDTLKWNHMIFKAIKPFIRKEIVTDNNLTLQEMLRFEIIKPLCSQRRIDDEVLHCPRKTVMERLGLTFIEQLSLKDIVDIGVTIFFMKIPDSMDGSYSKNHNVFHLIPILFDVDKISWMVWEDIKYDDLQPEIGFKLIGSITFIRRCLHYHLQNTSKTYKNVNEPKSDTISKSLQVILYYGKDNHRQKIGSLRYLFRRHKRETLDKLLYYTGIYHNRKYHICHNLVITLRHLKQTSYIDV